MAGKPGRTRQDALTLIASLRNDWGRVATAKGRKEHAEIHRWCLEELMGLVRELEADDT